MKYTKPPLTFSQQADMLIGRGLIAEKNEIVSKLKAVNYYRLSGYWLPFKKSDNTFKPGTTFSMIWRRYTFDRQLRLIVLDAIERFEVSVRTNIAYSHSLRHGPMGYTNYPNLPNITPDKFNELMKKIRVSQNISNEAFVKHFITKYGNNQQLLPIWMTVELMTFGMTLTMFSGIDKNLQAEIASKYNIPGKVLKSWLIALNTVRNICAHHGRLRDKPLSNRPMIPSVRKFPQWHIPVKIKNDRIFAILSILKYNMDIIAPQSSWSQRVRSLINQYSEIPIAPMGFPENWYQSSIWKD
jgi:abortive infection bacteriophage resistance protein